MSKDTILKKYVKINMKKPKNYKVIMHNDDYTTMEFVIKVLVEIFNKNAIEATKIMYDVHRKGSGVAGVYVYDIARTKLSQAMEIAKKESFPFLLSLEEE